VSESPDPKGAGGRRTPMPGWLQGDRARTIGPHLLALGVYGSLALLLTWPIATRMGSSILGIAGDNLGGVHTLWWVWNEIANLRFPWRVEAYGFPSSKVFFHPSPLMEIFSLPITALFGPVVSFNALLLLSFTASGYTCFLLVRHLCGSLPVALVGGALFTATGQHQFDLLFNTNANWALPLTVLALLRWRERPQRWPEVALAASALALSNFYFGAYFLPVLFLVFMPWKRIGEARVITSAVAAGATTLFACILAYLPPLIAIDDQTRAQLAAVADGEESRPPTEVLSLVIGAPGHPVLGDVFAHLGSGLDPTQAPNTGSAYLGVIVIILALVGWSRARATGPWTLLALVAGLLLLGPRLLVAGQALMPLPYAAMENVPLINYLRAPGRFHALLALPLIVMTSFGLMRVAEGLRARRAPAAGVAGAILLIGALGVFDSLFRFPAPTTPAAVPPVYAKLAELPGRPALIEVPGGGFNDYQWLSYQRESDLPLVNDASPRGSAAAPIPLYQNPFLAYTVAGPSPELLDSDQEYFDRTGRPNPERVRGVRELARIGVGYALLHQRTIFAWGGPDEGYWAHRAFLERYLGEPVFEDQAVAVYALPGAPGLETVRSW
jgi:hypothetical protein